MDNVKFIQSLDALNGFQTPKTPEDWMRLGLPQLLTVMADPILTPDEPLYLQLLQRLVSEHFEDFEFEEIKNLSDAKVVNTTIEKLISLLSAIKDECKEYAVLLDLLAEYKNQRNG